ncbi:hypothetical protein Pmani_013452 [Petrolisthes manimaculis]|uniref:Uncharacterized protein n=1 Tax=Petrolisthes manimaculis TaxID=1843537 RepID=A0AAE1PWG3_9EUCA|nr:hypothetical protein Pmani_013452 [Petrolisthes manimaculis]
MSDIQHHTMSKETPAQEEEEEEEEENEKEKKEVILFLAMFLYCFLSRCSRRPIKATLRMSNKMEGYEFLHLPI